jgi:hypothetical protein
MVALVAFVLALAGSNLDGERPFTVTVDVSQVDRATMGDEAINASYKSLLLRLIGEGFQVAERGGDIAVEVLPAASAETLRIVVRSAAAKAERDIPVASTTGEEAQLRLVHEAVDLVREARDALTAARAATPVRAAPPPIPSTVPPAHPAPALGARAGAAIAWSGSSPGLLADLGAELSFGRWSATLGFFAHQPLDLPGPLSLSEGGALVGLAGEQMLTRRLSLNANLSGGILGQRYRYSDTAAASDSGLLWDPVGALRIGADVCLSRRWRLGLFAGALLTLHDREHVTAAGSLWHGSRLRPFVGLGAKGFP